MGESIYYATLEAQLQVGGTLFSNLAAEVRCPPLSELPCDLTFFYFKKRLPSYGGVLLRIHSVHAMPTLVLRDAAWSGLFGWRCPSAAWTCSSSEATRILFACRPNWESKVCISCCGCAASTVSSAPLHDIEKAKGSQEAKWRRAALDGPFEQVQQYRTRNAVALSE